MSAPLRLSELLRGIADAAAVNDIVIRGLTLDSRRVRAGDAFIALRGSNTHGITFAPAALAHGASGVVCRRPSLSIGQMEEGRRQKGRSETRFPEPWNSITPGLLPLAGAHGPTEPIKSMGRSCGSMACASTSAKSLRASSAGQRNRCASSA